jgi:hypothetical protein
MSKIMNDLTEVIDTFFNDRPASRANEMETLCAENAELRAMIRRAHQKDCYCFVCSPLKASDK